MKRLTVHTGREYDILIERGLLAPAGEHIRNISHASKAAVVADSNVSAFYGEALCESLTKAGFETGLFTFQAGEERKRLATIAQMYGFFASRSMTRSDIVVALGGGVTGDMAGFAAATYLRGIDCVQIPTSLLAQIDSSVGGKTGVDIDEGKNLVGAFWQPRLVLIDPNTLKTLPSRYFADGMSEAIKYGCIRSRALFDRICEGVTADTIDDSIYECVDIKRGIVERDERESGERMLLNFGHTLGHALEKLYNYGKLSHGEAVGIGMVLITRASEHAGLTEPGTAQEIVRALQKYNIPISDPSDLSQIAAAAGLDKKSAGKDINLILVKHIGEGFVHKMPHVDLYDFISGGNL